MMNLADKVSKLKNHPKSRVIEHGYLNIYTDLNSKEKRYITFNSLYKKLNPAWNNTMVLLVDKFKNSLKTNKNVVLDMGCGHGSYIIDEARNKIDWAVGIDVDKRFVSGNKCLDEIVVGNVSSMPFKDASFDFVTSTWVVEHLADPVLTFKEVRRVLKKGGKFLFCTTNENFFMVKIKNILEMIRLDKFFNRILYGRTEDTIFPTLYRANDINSLEHILKESGFDNVVVTENFDPGYTSIDKFTFYLTRLLGKLKVSGFNAHIVGVVTK